MAALPADRIMKMGAGGAVGGFLTFVALNPSIARTEQPGQVGGSLEDAVGRMFTHALLFGGMLGLSTGGALVAIEELLSGSIPRLARRLPLALFVGGLTGAVGGIVAQLVYVTVLAVGAAGAIASGGRDIPMPLAIVARTTGWCLAGASAGMCPGVAASSWRRVWQGVLGGVVGGGTGGLLFDVLASATGSGTPSRAVGFVVTGLAIGVAVSLVEEFGKRFWLTGLTGAREGRSYILAKPQTTIGRDEMADIPVFGDPSVQRQHAVIVVAPTQATVIAQPGAAATVNRQPVASAFLSDGDVVGIGRHLFRFNARRAVGPLPAAAPEARMPYTDAAPAGSAAPPTPGGYGAAQPGVSVGAAPTAPVPTLGLQVISGPHAGQQFAVMPGATIGREFGLTVLLDRDMRVSRRHAHLSLVLTGWQVDDLGSSNGLWVNGMRVTTHVLSPGDRIGVGDTELLVS